MAQQVIIVLNYEDTEEKAFALDVLIAAKSTTRDMIPSIKKRHAHSLYAELFHGK